MIERAAPLLRRFVVIIICYISRRMLLRCETLYICASRRIGLVFVPNALPQTRRVLTIIALALTTTLVAGCAATNPAASDRIIVEGHVSVRGNEPFTAVVLETDQRTRYLLVLTPEMRSALSAPARIRVTGRLFLGEWNGRPYAHIEVERYAFLEEGQSG